MLNLTSRVACPVFDSQAQVNCNISSLLNTACSAIDVDDCSAEQKKISRVGD